eukprot:scaffold16.g102.t1
MAESRGELELYNQWFVVADVDRDGAVSGAEAVAFFARSGLPQHPTLFKVWQYVAGDRPALSRQEFYTALKLVSLAQRSGGVLDDAAAVRLVNGLAGPVPPPVLHGLDIPRGIELPQGLAPPPGGVPPAPPGAALAPRPAAVPPPPTAWPPLAPEQAAAFNAAFGQLDGDRDGYVQGVDCFGALMQSGLPKQALYLIDCVKRGIPLPPALPGGQFPPVAGVVSIAGLGPSAAAQDIYSASLQVPPMIPRQTYQPQPPAMPLFQSQVPTFPQAQVAALQAAEQARLEAERQEALKREAEQRQAEEERAAAAAKREFFTHALSELRLAQSKVSRTVVEAQQRLEMERVAAQEMESDYSKAYADFSVKHAQAAPLVEALEKAQAEKAALAAKVEGLRAMVAQLEDFDPEWESREKGECEALHQEIRTLTARREALSVSAAAVQAQRDRLVAQTEALRGATAAAEAALGPLQQEVAELEAKGAPDREATVAALTKLAPLYNALYAAAKAALVPLPPAAVASIKKEAAPPFKYEGALLAADAADWAGFKDEGFRIVSALPPDTRLDTLAPPSAAALAEEAAATGTAAAAAEGAAATAPAAAAADPAAADPAAAEDGATDVQPAGGGADEAAADAALVAGAAAAAVADEGGGKAAVTEAAPAAPEAPEQQQGAKVLRKQSSLAAEEEAVRSAAKAGVLASTIAEALAGVGLGSPKKEGKKAAKEASAAAPPPVTAERIGPEAATGEGPKAEAAGEGPKAEVAGEGPKAEAAGAELEAPTSFETSFDSSAPAEVVAPLPAAAFVAAFGDDAFGAAGEAAEGGASEDAAPSPPLKQASGGFGSTVALQDRAGSPKAASGGGEPAAAAGEGATSVPAPAPAPADSWTAF